MSANVYSVIPLMVYVFPLLVCPYAKMLAKETIIIFSSFANKFQVIRLQYKVHLECRGEMLYSQLIPLRTERATALAASSYTCFVEQSQRNTRSITQT